jgi:hypothetical protein
MDPRDFDPQSPNRQAPDSRPPAAAAGDDDELQLAGVDALLASARVVARPGFAREVMAALPATAPWQGRRVQGWRSALLALAALVVLAIGFLGFGGSRLAPASPALAAARAVADFGAAAALSGAGLLAASWRGVGLALGNALDLPAQLVFALGVLAVNALLLVLLRRRGRRRRALVAATTRRWR